MNILNLIMIIVVVTCYVAAFSKRAQMKLAGSSLITKAEREIEGFIAGNYRIMLALIVFVACFVRLWKFGVIPYGFNQDEAMAGLEALSLANNGTDHYGMTYPVYFTAWISSQMNVLLSYIQAPLFRLFGPSIALARLPLLVFSLVSLRVVYCFSYRMFGRNAALAILSIAAINPWQIMISKWALEANLLPHLLLYGCYFIYLGIEKKRYIFVSMIFFGLSMYAYGIAYYLVPFLLVSLCVFLCVKRSVKWYDVVICFVIYMAISWPIFTMMYVNYFKVGTIELPFMTIPYFEKGERLKDILFFSDEKLKQFGLNFAHIVIFIFLQVKDCLWNSIPSIGPFYYIGIPLLFLGLAFFIDEALRKESSGKESSGKESSGKDGIVILFTLFGASFLSGLITNNVNLNRMNAIAYPVLFMIGYAVYQIVKRLKITLIPISLMFAVLFCSFSYQYYYGDFSEKLGTLFYKGFVESVCCVKDLEYERLFVTSRTQGDNAEFPSEIITQFLLELDSEYTTGKCIPADEKLPYDEKYIFGISPEHINNDDVDAIYVIRNDELKYFDRTQYNILEFDGYCVVINKSNKTQRKGA